MTKNKGSKEGDRKGRTKKTSKESSKRGRETSGASSTSASQMGRRQPASPTEKSTKESKNVDPSRGNDKPASKQVEVAALGQREDETASKQVEVFPPIYPKEHRIVSKPDTVVVVVHGASAVIQLPGFLLEVKSKVPSIHMKIVYTKSAIVMLTEEAEHARIKKLLEIKDCEHYGPTSCYANFSKDARGRVDYTRVAAECLASCAHLVVALPMTVTGLESLSRARNDTLAQMVENLALKMSPTDVHLFPSALGLLLDDDQATINLSMVRLRGFKVHKSGQGGVVSSDCVDIICQELQQWRAKCDKFGSVIRFALELLDAMHPERKAFHRDEISKLILQAGLLITNKQEQHFDRAVRREIRSKRLLLNQAGLYSLHEWLDGGGDEDASDRDEGDGDGGPKTIDDAGDVAR